MVLARSEETRSLLLLLVSTSLLVVVFGAFLCR